MGNKKLAEVVRAARGRLASPRGKLAAQACLFPCAILWLEAVLKLSTTGWDARALPFMALFSLAGGLVAFVATSWPRRPRVVRGLRLALLALLCVAYGVEYFVFREFKMFYDLATVSGGASHAARGFGDQIALLVLNPSGLAHVALMVAPAVAYALLMRHDPASCTPRLAARAVGGAVMAHLLAATLAFSAGSFGLAYSERYSFQESVQSYGLLASLRREVTNALSGTGEVSFSSGTRAVAGAADEASVTGETSDVSPMGDTDGSTTAPASSEPTLAAIAPSTLDIDFSALAATTDGTWASLDAYVAAQEPSLKNDMTGLFEGFNLVFVSAEALSAEAIRPDTTPTLWRLATRGIQFTDYYQPASAGTTGGEYLNIFGMLPTDGGASVIDTATHNNWLTMGNALNRRGYDGWAFHNNDYTYYSRDLTHNRLGYSHGYVGLGNGMEQWVQSQWPESDYEMVKGTWDHVYGQLGDVGSPFDVYYMSVSGHSLYGRDVNDMSDKWWDEVAGLPYSEPVRAYLAANIDLDRAMEYLVSQLEERGIADRTVIVIAADHFPYGLDGDGYLGSLTYLSELYGYDVTTLLGRDHNRLIVWSGLLEEAEPIVVDTPTSSMDILPTLLNLFGAEWDSRLLPGRDVFSDREALVFDLAYDWKTELGTYVAADDAFTPVAGADVPDGYVERMHVVVADKVRYCSAVLDTDYFRHVFGEPEDVAAVNAAGKEAYGDAGERSDLWGSEVIRQFKAKHNLK